MSRQDSSIGLYNFTQTIVGSSATPLLAPAAASVNPGFPSPLFPLSTTTYPVGLFIGVPRDSGAYDSHPFEVQLTANISGTTTTSALVNLFQVSQSTWKDGPYAGTYTAGVLGTGCTNVVTGTSTAGITASTRINFWMRARFIWSSATNILSFGSAEQWINGSVVSIAATASVSSVNIQDLSFIPQFTFASGGVNTIAVSEFTISRL
jgi:hypothetical protein